MRPLIGIVSLYDEERESFWMLPGYVKSLEEAGAAPVILPLTEDPEILARYAGLCDGFLFTGGQDVDPALYGAEKSEQCGQTCPERDVMERLFFPLALKTEKPMFGICRGIQLMNAMLGGTLYQDLPTERPSEVEHHGQPPYDQVIHTVSLEKDSPLYGILGLEELGVNSYHHQGVKELGRGLRVAAKGPDGLTEALWMPEHRFFLAVQWHPEFSYRSDENSRKLIKAFADACV